MNNAAPITLANVKQLLTSGKPLSPKMRSRLEIVFSVVATTAAVVALSQAIRPDPSKLVPEVVAMPMYAQERPDEPILRPEAPPPPKVDADFINAIARGDMAAMEKLYTKDTPADEMLPAAAESGNTNVIQWVLDHGGNIHEEEATPHAPILMADEHTEVVDFLIAHGAAEPTLSAAAFAGAPNAVERLLSKHVSPNTPDYAPVSEALGSTRATSENKKRIVDKLIAAHADLNRPGVGSDGTAMHALTAAVRACQSESDEKYSNGDLTVGDGTAGYLGPNEIPPSEQCLYFIKLLVNHRARPDGDTLSEALSLHESVLDAVLTSSAPLEPGATAVALTQMPFSNPKTIKKLVAKGVDWGWRDGEEDAALPLVAAVRRRDRDAVRSLLDAGAPANRTYKDGESALNALLDSLSEDSADEARLAELLIARGADVNRRLPDGRTPLFAAAEAGALKIIHILLDHGARVNELVLDDTALNAAEQSGHTSAARVLHSRGGRRAPTAAGSAPYGQ